VDNLLINRDLKISKEDNVLLFGPRGCGKSTMLQTQFNKSNCLWINLLLSSQEERYSRNPETLISEVAALPEDKPYVIVDEIQKIPKLLDIVHQLIESTNKIFILTGSSARKSKRDSANLLAGRAFVYNLSAFTFKELGEKFDLMIALTWGMLPKIIHYKTGVQRDKYLKSYARTYLREEVWAEQFIRELDPFRYFLEVAAQGNGKIINFSNIARDVGVNYKTVENYYSILEDTLLGFFLPAYNGSIRKQINQAPKFYFFDVGVVRALSRMLSVPVREQTNYFGDLFEHFIICEIKKHIEYFCDEFQLSYLHTKTGQEIDLIIKRPGMSTL